MIRRLTPRQMMKRPESATNWPPSVRQTRSVPAAEGPTTRAQTTPQIATSTPVDQ